MPIRLARARAIPTGRPMNSRTSIRAITKPPATAAVGLRKIPTTQRTTRPTPTRRGLHRPLPVVRGEVEESLDTDSLGADRAPVEELFEGMMRLSLRQKGTFLWSRRGLIGGRGVLVDGWVSLLERLNNVQHEERRQQVTGHRDEEYDRSA